MENKENDKQNQTQPNNGNGPKDKPVRVIEEDTTAQEFSAGHIIPGANPPKNEHQRGGFGNRDGKEGFGSDTASEGPSATGVNDYADDGTPPPDNMRTEDEGRGT
ncbi:hypothetical protein H9Q13_09475 [Pontibacter sp. JH31]|uniref:Uncharacterized protein n=1 Tax=Pontibacter aquaedesilientis TaxID=2766980 RepID=A0ABR7XGH2_9BACT|nr:hypothetical protein [Pontibacter aquaedesilientis]MBD1397394.1 hypothetical protein [Pontibacter aquaedesilientis]